MAQQLLSCDLHIHTNLDPVHGPMGLNDVTYSFKQAIDFASKKGLHALAFTHHYKQICTKAMIAYARKKDIILIPGFEAVIDGKDVLIYNATTDNITTFAQLAKERKKNPMMLVIAPHPYYPGSRSLGEDLLKHIDLFDCIEYCHFYLPFYNGFNKSAIRAAHQSKKPIIGTSDSHDLDNIGRTYTTVKSEKTKDAIITALKQGHCATVSKQVPARYIAKVILNIAGFSKIFSKN